MKNIINDKNYEFKKNNIKYFINIKEIKNNEFDNAFSLVFDEFVKYTSFCIYKKNYLEAKRIYIAMSKDYCHKNKTIVLGGYFNNELIGVLEINDNYISQIAVKDGFKQYGIGHRLFLESIKNKEEGDKIYLEADKNAIEIYKKWGFNCCENKYDDVCKMVYVITKQKQDSNPKIHAKKINYSS